MATDLLAAILDTEEKSLNPFNGRILYAEDMREDQNAQRRRLERVARLAGEGVAWGMEVDLAHGGDVPRTLTIQPGLAVTRGGQLLHLTERVDLDVAGEVAPDSPDAARFHLCGRETAIPNGLGPYVLLASPASEFRERAPYVGIKDRGVARSCGRRFVVEGVRFRLLHLDVEDGLPVPASMAAPIRELMLKATLSGAESSRLRNLLAHWCLGTGSHPTAFGADLYRLLTTSEATHIRYGPLDALRADDSGAGDQDDGRLTDWDVPLALFYWTSGGISFVDNWAVRRRLHRPVGAVSPLRPIAERRNAEAEAAIMQFQQHLASIARPGMSVAQLATIRARTHFRFLPAVGLIPERISGFGLTHLEFFDGTTYRPPVFVHDARLAGLISEAHDFPPIDLDESELIWLYRVRGNRQPVAATAPQRQPYLLFANGQLAYRGDAQYDLSYWNYSNYAPGVDALAPNT